jgi:glycopeptide antibiotics resistance protein
MESEKRNTLTIVLFLIYALVLIGVILFKLPFSIETTDSVRVINLIPFKGSFTDDGIIRLSEIIDNILAFVPLGIYISMLKSNWSFAKKALLIIGCTVVFEIIQFIFAIGRTDVTDILGNTLGGIIGIGIYTLLFRILKSRTNKIINIIVLILTVCALLFFAFLLFRNRWHI